MDAPAIIAVDHLSKRYGHKGPLAVDGVSFSVRRGQVFGLIGPDGAGKTSVIQVLAGVLSADGGDASVGGVSAVSDPEAVKARIGYMPQGLGQNLYDTLTVAENIAFFRDLRLIPESRFRENRDRLLAMTRLAPFLDRPAGKLSGGMRQKLALICTLLHLPDVLLLDEPTTGVDPLSRRDFWTIIHELVAERGVTVLLTTSYMDEAERCHDVALMHRGRIVAAGTPDELARGLPGTLVAVSGAPVKAIRAALADWDGATSVALFGTEVHVLLTVEMAALPAQLARQGLQGVAIRLITGGLEDVFVHRVTQRESVQNETLELAVTPLRPANEAPNHTVETHNLTCRFGDFTAVDRVNLAIETGEIFGLLGPNGAGKTTLIKMLCGLQKPSAGQGRVAGFDVENQRLALREHIGYMSQRFSLYRDLTVAANLELYAGLYGLTTAQRRPRIDSLLASLGLGEYANRLTGSLPMGLRQRLGLACALLHEPPVVFLDEPTSGVDPVARRQFWDIVHLLAEQSGVTVLVSTHYMDEAEHCHRLGLMQAGQLIALGTPSELKQTAQTRAGALLAVQTGDFAQAFQLLHAVFPKAMLYGRRIQWQTLTSEADRDQASTVLKRAGISAEIAVQGLSMEETFASFLESTGVNHV